MNILVKMLDTRDIEKLREAFLEIDKDGTGLITAPELKKVLSDNGTHIGNDEVETIINEVDY